MSHHNLHRRSKKGSRPHLLPKVTGLDSELANFIQGVQQQDGTGRDGTGKEAARLLLREFHGVPAQRTQHFSLCPCNECTSHRNAKRYRSSQPYTHGGSYAYDGGYATVGRDDTATSGDLITEAFNPQDIGRKFLACNGGCVYIDLDHLELCLPETRSAYDHVACWHAMLRIARRALDDANARLPEGQKIHVLVNNSDGIGHSYGSHVNFLITETCRRNIFERKMQYMLYLAAYQVSSIIFTGQGKVGSENGTEAVDFQLSQRADFFDQLTAVHTTHSRPIINSRDEPLCGTDSFGRHWTKRADADMARLHVIFYDNTLCHVATLLKVGVMQIVLAMIEAEAVNLELILEDPVRSLRKWSRDPSLQAKAATCSGRRLTAIELQRCFLEEAGRFVDRGLCDGIVPRARDIVDLWSDTLDQLESRDMDGLSRRIDWVQKRSILEHVLAQHTHLNWRHAAIKHLDLMYSSLDADEGLYWARETDGLVDRLVEPNAIDHFMTNPPEDTRAWMRAMLLRCAGNSRVSAVDWHSMRFVSMRGGYGPIHRSIELADPAAFTRESSEDIFMQGSTLDEIVDSLTDVTEPGSGSNIVNSHGH